MFVAFPFLYQRLGFWPTLVASCALTILLFVAWATVLKRFGVELM
jgi:hypothetical protein